MKRNIAYCAAPRVGGIYGHYRVLRETLAPLGWNVRAVSAGRRIAGYWQDGFPDEGCVRIAEQTDRAESVARALLAWCLDNDIQIVYMNGADYSIPAWNMLPHAPAQLRAVSRAYASTPFSYRAVLIHPDRLSAVIATSRRQLQAVKAAGALNEGRIHLIPHAVHPDFLQANTRAARPADAAIRLAYVGRINDPEKGVFRLPRALKHLDERGTAWTLDVIGDGPDTAQLFDRFRRLNMGDRVTRHGFQPRRAVAERLAACDVFLMTSHHEGFGIALIEAMAAGLVPVVFRIPDVSDWIVDDGRNGRVIEQGDTKAMADAIIRLNTDRPLLQRMSRAAQDSVRERFHPETMARAYDTLFSAILNEDLHVDPLPWTAFKPVRFPRSALNRLAHAVVPRSMRGRMGRWTRRFSS